MNVCGNSVADPNAGLRQSVALHVCVCVFMSDINMKPFGLNCLGDAQCHGRALVLVCALVPCGCNVPQPGLCLRAGYKFVVVSFWQEQAEKLLGSGHFLVSLCLGSAIRGVGVPAEREAFPRAAPPPWT